MNGHTNGQKDAESRPRVIVAMSGGVDSSVAAALLVEQGFDCVGMTMRVASGEGREHSDKACCTVEAAGDARRVADRLGIAHYTVNYVERFEREVIEDFAAEYAAGRTPNPCARCNQRVKFGALYEKCVALGADFIATGHYARKVERDGRVGLRRAVYRAKDQSYNLAGLGQAQLGRALFPLGEMTKEEARAIARDRKLVTWDKPESQEICFVPQDDYRAFLDARVGSGKPGPIVNTQGEVVGEHSGLTHYTVGQRKGLGIAAPRPYFVLKLDMANNVLFVGHEEETGDAHLMADEVVWGAMASQPEPFACTVQIRYRHEPVPATVTASADGATLDIALERPERGITPGQWAVCYDGDVVLAAGLIRG
jgi:tRNA-specific 2-thiouridylase